MNQPPPSNKSQIHAAVQTALQQYFVNLDGDDASDLYALFITEIERPLITTVMQQCNNNQSKAAQWLGISRNTLRKMLTKYQ